MVKYKDRIRHKDKEKKFKKYWKKRTDLLEISRHTYYQQFFETNKNILATNPQH